MLMGKPIEKVAGVRVMRFRRVVKKNLTNQALYKNVEHSLFNLLVSFGVKSRVLRVMSSFLFTFHRFIKPSFFY